MTSTHTTPGRSTASAAAFRHIQNADEPEDDATLELLRMARGDSAKDVRAGATKSFNEAIQKTR